VCEDGPVQSDSAVEAGPPEVLRHAACTGPLHLEIIQGECVLPAEAQITMRIPTDLVRSGSKGILAFRACCAAVQGVQQSVGDPGERLLFVGVIPTTQLPTIGAPGEAASLSLEVKTASGQASGVIRFNCHLDHLEANNTATGTENTLSDKEIELLLGAVSWQNLTHEELLAASRDPLLLQVGAQRLVVDALSSRLGRYETASCDAFSNKPPRNSTSYGTVKMPQKTVATTNSSPVRTSTSQAGEMLKVSSSSAQVSNSSGGQTIATHQRPLFFPAW